MALPAFMHLPRRRQASAAALAAALLLGACGGAAEDDAPSAPPRAADSGVERSVVVDGPVGATAVGGAAATAGATEASAADLPGALPPAPGVGQGARAAPDLASVASPVARPTADPLADAIVFATATADAAAALAAGGGSDRPSDPVVPASETAGSVVVLSPSPCAALTLDSAGPVRDCAAELLQSGRLEGRELMALVGFDLAALPAGAELLYAALELVTADTSFARTRSAWRVEAVDPPSPSFDQVLAALPLAKSLIWQVEAAEIAPGRRLTVELGAEARRLLDGRLAAGQGRLAFRIMLTGRSTGLAAWQARGERGPRLRLAYQHPTPPATAALDGLVHWAPPPAAATVAAP